MLIGWTTQSHDVDVQSLVAERSIPEMAFRFARSREGTDTLALIV